jgi:hypothetical protein
LSNFFVGLDLGQAQDYTALMVLEQVQQDSQRHYHLRHIERFPLGTSYPAIVERVRAMLQAEPLAGDVTLLVDKTGVGAPVVDMFKTAGLSPVAITITGGDSVAQDSDGYRVPKRDLVSALQVLLQGGRLKIAASLPLARVLQQELLSFKVKINVATAHDSYGAWREGEHDDLVIGVALACWYAERQPLPVDEQVRQMFHRASFWEPEPGRERRIIY